MMESLQKKYHGLPVYAWAAIAAVVLLLGWRYMKSRGGSGSSAAASTGGSSDAGATPIDTTGAQDFQTPTDLTGPDQPAQPGGGVDPYGFTLPGDNGQGTDWGGTDLNYGPPPSEPSNTGTLPTDGKGGSFSWGGQSFSSQSQFKAWVKAHGGNLATILAKHPALKRTYTSLPAGSPASTVGSKIVKGGRKKPAKVKPVSKRVSTRSIKRKPSSTGAPKKAASSKSVITPRNTPKGLPAHTAPPATKAQTSTKRAIPVPAPPRQEPQHKKPARPLPKARPKVAPYSGRH